MSIPHPSAFVSKRSFLRQLLSPLHPAIVYNMRVEWSQGTTQSMETMPSDMARRACGRWGAHYFIWHLDAVLRMSGGLRLWYGSTSIHRLDPSRFLSGAVGLAAGHVRATLSTLHHTGWSVQRIT